MLVLQNVIVKPVISIGLCVFTAKCVEIAGSIQVSGKDCWQFDAHLISPCTTPWCHTRIKDNVTHKNQGQCHTQES